MSCKCKNIIENFQGGSIPLDTTFLRDVYFLGAMYSGGTNLLDIFSGGTGPGSSSGLFAETADSIPVSATTTPGSLVGTGVGEFKFPANSLQVGDTFHLKGAGLLKNTGSYNTGMTISLFTSESGILLDTGELPINYRSDIDRPWGLELDLTIRSTGISGTVQIVGEFNFAGYVPSIGPALSQARYIFHQNSPINTTSDNNLQLTGQWAGADYNVSIHSNLLYLNKVY